MRRSLSLGLGLRVGQRRGAVGSIDSVTAPTLTQAVPTSIVVTATGLDGQTCDVTVNGETWGSEIVVAGTATVSGTPTAAMVGTGVTVEATIGGVTNSDETTNVYARTRSWVGDEGKTGDPVSVWTDDSSATLSSGAGAADGGDYLNFSTTKTYTIDASIDASENSFLLVWALDWTPNLEALLRLNGSYVVQTVGDGRLRVQDGGAAYTFTGFMASGERVLSVRFDATAGTITARLIDAEANVTSDSDTYATVRTLANGGGANDVTFNGKLWRFLAIAGTLPTLDEQKELEEQVGVDAFGTFDPLP